MTKAKTAKVALDADIILTADQVAFFWNCVIKWKAVLGLQSWRITHRTVDRGRFLALTDQWDARQRQVRITLCLTWSPRSVPTETTLEQTAVHELLHVVLHRLLEVASDRGAPQGDQDFEEHGVINMLENTLLSGGDGL